MPGSATLDPRALSSKRGASGISPLEWLRVYRGIDSAGKREFRRTRSSRSSRYSLEELAERWAIHKRTIHREVARGRLKKKLIGGRIRFAVDEVERYERVA